jgi:hypothetical protein
MNVDGLDNLGFIVAAYAACFGALALYIGSLYRRRRDGA